MKHSAWTRVACVFFGATATAAPSFAQVVPSEKVAVVTRADPAELAPREVTRLALLDLRSLTSPGPGDFAITAGLLSIAQDLAPNDADIVRRRAEAAYNAGDNGVVDECTKRLVELDPSDTVAQLRYITSRIGTYQTAEARLAAYDALVGAKGQTIDTSIRSRLALDASLLARERGDTPGFVDRLKKAISLDATNKDAALLAYTYFAERVDDRQGRLELLANLMYADPLDPKTLRLMRDEFAQAGAYQAAIRFHRMIAAIQNVSGVQAAESFQIEGMILQWLTQGPAFVVTDLSTRVATERHRVAAAGASDPNAQAGLGTLRPEDVRLSLGFEELRLVVAKAGGEKTRATLAESLKDLWATTQNQSQAVLDPTRRPAGMTVEVAANIAIGMVLETKLLRLLVHIGDDQGAEQLNEAIAGLPADDVRRVSLEAWTLLREEKYEEVIARVAGFEAASSWTGAAKAEALLARGDTPGAAAMFAKTAELFPLATIGAYCAQRAIELEPNLPRFAEAKKLEAYNAQLPKWLDDLATQPRRTQLLTADFGNWGATALQRVPVKVRLKNLLPIPVGMGSGRAISTRLFFAPSLEIGIRSRNDQAAGEVVELDRRLRLNPNEEFTATVWPDTALIGYLGEVGATDPSRLRWRILQGFEILGNGLRQAGPGSLECSTGSLSREALPEAREPLPKLAERLVSAKENELAPIILAIRSRLMGGRPDGVPDPEASGIIKFLVQLYPTWPVPIRMIAVAALPPSSILPGLAPVDAVFAADPDPAVLALVVVSRVTLPTDPVLEAAKQSSDTRLVRLATLHQERLATQTLTYSVRGPNVLVAMPNAVSPSK